MKNFFKKIGDKITYLNEMALRKWLVIILVFSIVLEFFLEVLGRRSFFNAYLFVVKSPVVFMYNILIIFFTLSLAIMLRKRLFGFIFISVLWLTCGIVNFTVLGYRITPFSAIDFLMATDAFSMLDIYFTGFQQILLFVGVIVLVILLGIIYIKSPKFKGQMRYVRNFIFCFCVFLVVYGLTVFNLKYEFISDDFANLGMAYNNYGFAYCFSNSIIDVGMNEPDNYNEEMIGTIVEQIDHNRRVGPEKRVNVIIIQLESFIDIDRVSGVNVDKDPIPNFNRLMKEYPSGFLTVPSIGAGTANTEFEVITGMRSSLFGAGEYPYKTVLSSTPTESMAQVLKRDGYGVHAIHNNKGVFYSRNEVYANLGFDDFISLEYMYDFNQTETGWAKDDVLISDIKKCMRSTIDDKDFIFTISVQGHGRYPTDELHTEEFVKVTRDDGNAELEMQFGYYVNQTYEMDQMIAELIKELDKTEEKYVLFLYGDHIPSLTFEEGQFKYGNEFQTEYVMVNNIGLDIPDQDLYSYEVSDYILTALNLPQGYMQKLHGVYRKGDISLETYFEYAELLQYDLIYGEHYANKYDENEEYTAADMKLGLWPIVLSDVEYIDGDLIVKGRNFNLFSTVIIDEKRYETELINNNILKISAEVLGDEPEKGVLIRVGQIDKEKHELSTTDSIEY